jgi:copper chaperone
MVQEYNSSNQGKENGMKKSPVRGLNKFALLIILAVSALTVAAAFAFRSPKGGGKPFPVTEAAPADTSSRETVKLDEKTAKVVLSVSNMSCSGCIATIKGSLASMGGIKDVVVDLAGGRAEVYYDSSVLKDVSGIARAITESGYPATVQRVLSAQDVQREWDTAEAKSKYTIASVGGWDIARADFTAEMDVAKRRYGKLYGEKIFDSTEGKSLENGLKSQVLGRLIDEGIIMQEISKADYKLDPQRVEQAFQDFLREGGRDPEAFKQQIQDAGYDLAYFKKKFGNRMFINGYLGERVLANAENDLEKQSLLNAWYSNAKTLAPVVYYDKDLEQLTQNQSSSSSCCSSR